MSNVIIVTGYAGSGKTTFSRSLASAMGCCLLDKDVLFGGFVDSLLVAQGSYACDRESWLYRSSVKKLEYEALESAIADNIVVGSSVVATAPWLDSFRDDSYWALQRQHYRDSYGANVYVIWVQSSVLDMRKRIVQRGEERDSYKLSNWDDYASSIVVGVGARQADYVVDNSGNVNSLIKEAHIISEELLSSDR